MSSPGFFSLGVAKDEYKLPHPRIPLSVLLIIRRVFIRAFEILRARNAPLGTMKEDEITINLFNVIENDLRKNASISGFSRATFGSVVRHACVENYNFTMPKKEPDLCFKLRSDEVIDTNLSAHHGLFVECKPIDKSHAAGSAYCDEGIQRFVDGEYAWAMQDGLMVGYARDGRNLAKHLQDAMTDPEPDKSGVIRSVRLKTVEIPQTVQSGAARAAPFVEALNRSRHRRGFPWPDGKGNAVDIFIFHSWHACD